MKLSPEVCYKALSTRDRRFDGLFFCAVSSTHIYCRPVCTVKLPQSKNCSFYESAAICELRGFRPCLRCRPELAPGTSSVDSRSSLVKRAIYLIEEGVLAQDSIEELATELDVTSRHLRRVFESEIGVAPVQFVQTQRLLMAKRLLTDTFLPITQVAMISGFKSVRRFNTIFLERYRLNPSQLRKLSVAGTGASPTFETFICHLSYRPPYDWHSMLNYLRERACPGVEFVTENSYMRTVAIDDVRGWLSVSHDEKHFSLIVTLSSSLAPKLMQVLSRLKRLFDLQAVPELIEMQLGEIALKNPGLRVPGAFDSFEVALRAILGQVVSVKFASTLARRVTEKFGESVVTPIVELHRLAPQACVLASATVDELSALGIMRPRASTIIGFSKEYARGELTLDPGVDYESSVKKLTSLDGIGAWTAEYIAMRCLSFPDAFLHGDLGIKKALNMTGKKEIVAAVEKYRPWRSYATMHIWKTLEVAKVY